MIYREESFHVARSAVPLPWLRTCEVVDTGEGNGERDSEGEKSGEEERGELIDWWNEVVYQDDIRILCTCANNDAYVRET
jgi:hypothetical protein